MPDRWLSLYANAGQLVDLTPFLAEWDGTAELTDATKSFGSVIAGQTHMIPYGFYLRAMFWNKKLFAEAGLDRAPETLQEFYDYSAKIAELDGKYGYCLRGGPGATNGYIMMMLNFLGENKYFDENGQSTLNDPKAVEGLQFIVDMYQDGLVPRDSVNWGFNEIVAGFYSGTCAMLDQDPDALIAIKERMNVEDFAVAPMPLGPDCKAFPTIGYAGWSMFQASQHKDEAFALMAFLSSPEMNLEWAKFVGVLPIHDGAEADPFFATEQFAGWFTEINDDRWEFTPHPAHLEEYGYWADTIAIQTGQEALLGQRSAQEVADEWAAYFTDAQKKWLAKQ
jgi:multiple sugar transport system substrate-binding protein